MKITNLIVGFDDVRVALHYCVLSDFGSIYIFFNVTRNNIMAYEQWR